MSRRAQVTRRLNQGDPCHAASAFPVFHLVPRAGAGIAGRQLSAGGAVRQAEAAPPGPEESLEKLRVEGAGSASARVEMRPIAGPRRSWDHGGGPRWPWRSEPRRSQLLTRAEEVGELLPHEHAGICPDGINSAAGAGGRAASSRRGGAPAPAAARSPSSRTPRRGRRGRGCGSSPTREPPRCCRSSRRSSSPGDGHDRRSRLLPRADRPPPGKTSGRRVIFRSAWPALVILARRGGPGRDASTATDRRVNRISRSGLVLARCTPGWRR